MAAIARHPLEIPAGGASDGSAWQAFASRCVQWSAGAGVSLRDCIVLLPFAQLLPLAQSAFAALGGWQPRIETTQTLARSLGPAVAPQEMQLAFDAAVDPLTAARLLRSQALGAEWARRDPRGFDAAVAMVVQTATELARAAAAVPPALRAAHWEAARGVLAPLAGPGGRERWLARIALEWAALAPPPHTDRLFALRPSAWIALQAGGADPFVDALFDTAAASLPCLRVDADPSGPLLGPDEDTPAFAVCDGFEQEAQRAAALVIDHLAAGRQPVALVGQDRLLVRRVRALLERHGVQAQDETGWTLSTTRAAAQLMLLLRAAAPRARADELFDWLKTLPAGPLSGIDRLEQACRKRGLSQVAQLGRLDAGSEAAETWAALRPVLERLADRRRPLSAWLQALREALVDARAWPALQADAAGQALLRALRLDERGSPGSVWREAAAQATMGLEDLTRWVDRTIEQARFEPGATQAQVLVTPMARLLLRPFAAVVWPGADDQRLGARPAPHELLDDATLRQLGLPDAQLRRGRERSLFAQALRLPRITFLRRRIDDKEPLGDSPLLQGLALDLADQGRRLREAADPRRRRALVPTPVARPAPSVPGPLPATISASAAEALRECPYRFYARHLLRLREDEELDDEIEKRDYGTWLHAVLLRFHAEREAPADAAAEAARLLAIADEERALQGLADEALLPYSASLASLAPRYVAWLHERDAAGSRWQDGERDLRVPLPAVPGVELQGVIDRIDAASDGTLELIDYKTGSAEMLKHKLREPLEDTQLAFYAALLDPSGSQPMAAAYLPLDTGKPIAALPHPQVQRSAVRLVAGLGGELARVRDGAPLPALGEARACEFCEMRGLCRRDHWSAS